MSPSRRRSAVFMLEDRLGLSERRACQFAGQHRSTQRREPLVAEDDAALRARLRELSRERPRWGYRRAHADCSLKAGNLDGLIQATAINEQVTLEQLKVAREAARRPPGFTP